MLKIVIIPTTKIFKYGYTSDSLFYNLLQSIHFCRSLPFRQTRQNNFFIFTGQIIVITHLSQDQFVQPISVLTIWIVLQTTIYSKNDNSTEKILFMSGLLLM